MKISKQLLGLGLPNGRPQNQESVLASLPLLRVTVYSHQLLGGWATCSRRQALKYILAVNLRILLETVVAAVTCFLLVVEWVIATGNFSFSLHFWLLLDYESRLLLVCAKTLLLTFNFFWISFDNLKFLRTFLIYSKCDLILVRIACCNLLMVCLCLLSYTILVNRLKSTHNNL